MTDNIEQMLVMSTAHAPSCAALDGATNAHAVMQRDTGGLFYIPEQFDSIADWPDWLLAIARQVRGAGCCWLMLDADADRFDDLPSWEW